MKNLNIHAQASRDEKIDIEKAVLQLRGIAFDPEKGMKLDSLTIKGNLAKEGNAAGNFRLSYSQIDQKPDSGCKH